MIKYLLFLLIPLVSLASEKDNVLVVFNPRLEGSKELAEYYAEKRHLSSNQLLALPCSPNESISREDFKRTIQKPLIDELIGKGWWKINRTGDGPQDWVLVESRLNYLVLCHGIPLKIDECPADQLGEPKPREGVRQEFLKNGAAVDSELAVLPNPKALATGFIKNPYFAKTNFEPNKDWNLKILLVTRLDGPNPEVAKRLIDSAIAGEENGLWGRAVVDMRGIDKDSPFGLGDQWLRKIADNLKVEGWNPYVDVQESTIADPAVFDSCAIYIGWYADSICGPPASQRFHFQPGAIAYHIHSFSAASLRTYDAHWAGPFVARGVAATMGCVDEPYLQFTPYMDLFFKQMFSGKNFAESAYISLPLLSWQITIIGDPLYRPFGRNFDQQLAVMKEKNDPNLPWAYLRQVNQLAAAGMTDQAIKKLQTDADENPNPLSLERLAQLFAEKNDNTKSIVYWKQCVETATNPILKASYLISLARQELLAGENQSAFDHYKEFTEKHPDHPLRIAIINEAKNKALEKGLQKEADYFNSLLPPPPPPPPAKTS